MDRLVGALSPADVARAGRYRYPEDARRFAAARGWLRHVLGAELGIDAAGVELVEGSGKPRLAGGADLRFNLSHAGELAVIATAGSEVGIDVEHLAGARRALEAAPVACTPAETEALAGLPGAARTEAFLRMWTAKEAYLKARGVGLSVSPARVEVGAAAGRGEAAPVRLTGEEGPPRWWVREVGPLTGYVGCVASVGCDWEVVLRDPAELRCRTAAATRRVDRVGPVTG